MKDLYRLTCSLSYYEGFYIFSEIIKINNKRVQRLTGEFLSQ